MQDTKFQLKVLKKSRKCASIGMTFKRLPSLSFSNAILCTAIWPSKDTDVTSVSVDCSEVKRKSSLSDLNYRILKVKRRITRLCRNINFYHNNLIVHVVQNFFWSSWLLTCQDTVLTCLVLNAPEKNEFFIATHISCNMMWIGHGQSFGVIGSFFHGAPLNFLKY